jgi:hypothetical protein
MLRHYNSGVCLAVIDAPLSIERVFPAVFDFFPCHRILPTPNILIRTCSEVEVNSENFVGEHGRRDLAEDYDTTWGIVGEDGSCGAG